MSSLKIAQNVAQPISFVKINTQLLPCEKAELKQNLTLGYFFIFQKNCPNKTIRPIWSP
jgi:hypothetical protein